MDEALNGFASWVALATAVPLLVGVVAYGFGSPWYDSWLGRITFSKWVSVLLIFIFIICRRLFGDFPGFGVVAIILYSLFFITYTAMAVVVIVEQQSPEPGVFAEEGTHHEQFQFPPKDDEDLGDKK